MKKAFTVEYTGHIQQILAKLLQNVLKRKIQNRQLEERMAAENELIDSYCNRDVYYRQMNYVSDNHLIDYYNFLLKAEDEKIGYLRKVLLRQGNSEAEISET